MNMGDALLLATRIGVLVLVVLGIVTLCYIISVLRRARGVLEEARGMMKDLQLRSARLLSDAEEMLGDGRAVVKLVREKVEETAGLVEGLRARFSAGRLARRAGADLAAALSALGEGVKTLFRKGG